MNWPQLYACTAGGNGAVFLLYSLIPYLGGRANGGFAAGLLTFAFMAASLPTQLAVPALSRVLSDRGLLGIGLALLGVPTLAYVPGKSLPAMVVITIVRGTGFGLFTVVSATVFTAKAGDAERGKTAARYGVIAAATAVFLPSAGLWLYGSFGRLPVFLVGCLFPLLPLLSITGARHSRVADPKEAVSIRLGVRLTDALPLTMIFFTGAALSGVYSFLPFRTGRAAASWILIAFGVAFAASRPVFGAAVDRKSLKTVVTVSGALAALGTTGIACSSWLALSLPSSMAMGGGLGGLATATLVYMVDVKRARRRVVGAALWNFAYDTGGAIGGIALGATVPYLSSSGPFLVLIGPFILLIAFSITRRFGTM